MTAAMLPTHALKVGLETAAVAAIQAAEPGAVVLFDWGVPDTWPDDSVLLMRTTSAASAGPMSPQRTRDVVVTCDLHVVCRRSTQREADERAYELLGWIEHHVRMVDPTLGGVAVWCFLTDDEADGATPDEDILGGRVCEIIATFTARVRISN